MRKCLASAAIAVFVSAACTSADTHYIVLSIEDPLGVAIEADQFWLIDEQGEKRTFERGDLPFPMTLTLTSESTAAHRVAVNALRTGNAIAACSAIIDFLRQDGGRARCVLGVDACAARAAIVACPCEGLDCPYVPPRLVAISPGQWDVAASDSVSVTLSGVEFAATARAYASEATLSPTVTPTASELLVDTPVASTDAGFLPVQVMNEPAGALSNTAWLMLVPASGFIVEDFNPDYGIAGDTFTLHGAGLGTTVVLVDETLSNATNCFVSPSGGGWVGKYSNAAATCIITSGWGGGLVTAYGSGGSVKARSFTVGTNIAPTASLVEVSTASPLHGASNLIDGDLSTSWQAEGESCAALIPCTGVQLVFDSPIDVGRVGIRGGRDNSARDILVARVDLTTQSGSIVTSTVWTDRPHGDANVDYASVVSGVVQVRVTSLVAESSDPVLAELEIFGTSF